MAYNSVEHYHDDELCCFTCIAFHTQKIIVADLHKMITQMNDAKNQSTSFWPLLAPFSFVSMYLKTIEMIFVKTIKSFDYQKIVQI